MEQQNLQQAAKALLDTRESVTLAYVTPEGCPRLCEMEQVRAQGIEHIFFITAKNSVKAACLRQNANAAVGFCAGEDGVSLAGYVEIVENEAQKKALLPAAYQERLRKKGSEHYCVLHFTTHEAKLYFDGVFETLTFL